MKSGSFTQMVEYKKNLPDDVFNCENDQTIILIVPFDDNLMRQVVGRQLSRPWDKKIYEECGDIEYCIRKITFVNSGFIFGPRF